METKEQKYEVVLFTTDEEVDGENLIDTAISEYIKTHKKEHISSVSVDLMRSEYQE